MKVVALTALVLLCAGVVLATETETAVESDTETKMGAAMDVEIEQSAEHELIEAVDLDDAAFGNPNGAQEWMSLPGKNGGTVYKPQGSDPDAPFFYRTKVFNTDFDGAPTAYSPRGRAGGALDYTANAGGPGNWYGVVTDNGRPSGRPVIQGANDPNPGFYVSQTSLEDPTKSRTDPRRYVDASKVPYAVLPSNLQGKGGAKMGDYATIINPKTGAMTQAIIADSGPRNQIGEGSKAAQDAIKANDDAIWVVYPNSRNKDKPFNSDPAAIQAEGQKNFDKFGGMKKINDMYGTKFPDQQPNAGGAGAAGAEKPAGAAGADKPVPPQGLMSQPMGLMSGMPPEDKSQPGGGEPPGGAPGGGPAGGAPAGGPQPGGDPAGGAPAGGGPQPGGGTPGGGATRSAKGAGAPDPDAKGEEKLEEKPSTIKDEVEKAMAPEGEGKEPEGKEGGGDGGADGGDGGGEGGEEGGDRDGGGGADRGGRRGGGRRGGRRGGRGRGDRRGGRGDRRGGRGRGDRRGGRGGRRGGR